MTYKKIFGFKFTVPETSDWEIDQEIQDKLSKEVLVKIYNDGEQRFNSTVDDLAQARTRAYGLITIFISLLSIMVALFLGDQIGKFHFDKKAIALLYFIDILVIAYCIIQLVIIISPESIMLKGEEPKKMNFEGMATLTKDEQIDTYLFDSVKVIQEKIEYNETRLEDKNKRLEVVIGVSTFTFVLTLIFAILPKLF